MPKMPTPAELLAATPAFPAKGWMDVKSEIRPGNYCYPAKPDTLLGLGFKRAHAWAPEDQDWNLPANWEDIMYNALKERLDKHRSLKVFMDVCVRCGACADKCHFFLGTNDPKNMPVLRAELLRSVYRKDFTLAGRLLGKVAGARRLDAGIIKEWYSYFYQCSECRRCSLYCPYGIDTAELTVLVREMLLELGLASNWIMDPVSNCNRTGNHLGIQPHAMKEIVEFLCDDIETITGIRIDPPFNEKGHEILFITPSGDYFADPGIYTFMGYLMLFHELGLDYTLSTYASEGGNFGSFVSFDMAKKLNAKMYAEAERLGSKWILGGECGHMWRVVNQYMATYNGPTPPNLEQPVSPITGTVFKNAAATKMVHIAEFTADLIHHDKLNLRPERNNHIITTWHDSCNPARGMGLLEEPRAVLRAVCNNFVEMPEHTIREETFCCGSGSGLNTEEIMDIRMRGGFPRANALRYVADKHNVNWMACVCALDRAALPPLTEYWVPEVTVSGLHELVANALVMKGEIPRTMDMRQEDLPFPDPEPEEPETQEPEEIGTGAATEPKSEEDA
ncbi:MAG: menaquinol oxidoreductase [Desulfovibrionaceae bacterium]|nr:MAG: menaquinol oxidoreductase [Desulfovibrionaceae bacterium]